VKNIRRVYLGYLNFRVTTSLEVELIDLTYLNMDVTSLIAE
jgi:hypothetical protein